MSHIEIDFDNGPHAASGLKNEQLELMHRIVTLEMAVRMNRADFIELAERVADARRHQDELVDQVRRDRDLLQFEATVMTDLDRLPLTTEGEGSDGRYNPDGGYGLYL